METHVKLSNLGTIPKHIKKQALLFPPGSRSLVDAELERITVSSRLQLPRHASYIAQHELQSISCGRIYIYIYVVDTGFYMGTLLWAPLASSLKPA